MKKQLIAFNPEIIQFISDREQLVKVTNLTPQPIDNCFFCMFNTQRYKFVPDYFSLEAYEEKLVTVSFLGKLAQRQIKQFAYLKSSSNFSKRITLINGPATISQEKFRSPQSGIQQLGTLSSREYRDSQIQGLHKIIADKQAYIRRLQKLNEELKDYSNKKLVTDFSESKTKNYYLNQIQDLQLKINLINAEKDELIRQNILLQKKFEEYKEMLTNDNKYEQINDLLIQKDELIKWEKQQSVFHENQCEKLMCKISDLQKKISEQEKLRKKETNEIQEKKESVIVKLQEEIAKIKESNSKATKIYEERIMQLEEELIQGTTERDKLRDMEALMEKKKKQIQNIVKELKNEQQLRTKVQQIKNKKEESEKVLQEKNFELTSRIQNLEKSIEELRSQNVMYRSKIEQQDSQTGKIGRFMQVALQSCKNQNQVLKASKIQLEKELQDKIREQKNTQNKMQSIQRQMHILTSEIQEIKSEKQELLARNRQTKQQNHETIMRLKSENIDLIEKINVFNEEKKKGEIEEMRREIVEKDKKIDEKQEKIRELTLEIETCLRDNEKLMKRIEKTRKQAKKEIKSIQDDTLSELKKVKHQKNALSKKVAELEESINSETYDLSRAKTKTHYDTPNNVNPNIRTRCPRSQGDRKLGIRNQRKQLQESRNSSNMPQIDLQGLYSQLGQLREYKNYVNNELEKLGKIFGLITNFKQNDKNQENKSSIFATINFFDDFKQQLHTQQQKTQRAHHLQNENNFLKGRLTELEFMQRQTRDQKDLPSEIEFQKQEPGQNLMEYVRKQMKNQYSKQYDALKLAEEKFNLLKRKIYEEYRSRIIGVISNKNKDDKLITRIEGILERFIEGLSNLSHKEAVLAKQIRLKQSARKQAQNLRNKVKQLTQIIEMKKGYCSREPLNVFMCQNDSEWHDVIKLQAKILTNEAQLSKLQEELELSKTNASYLEQELKLSLTDLKDKEDEVNMLKKQIIKIGRENEKQRTKMQDQYDTLQKKYFENNSGNGKKGNILKDGEYAAMKEDLQRKKQIIKNLKEKEKMLEQLLDSTQRNESEIREKSRRDILQEQRKENALRQMKEVNRQLRTQNRNMKEQIRGLAEELQTKTNQLKKYKNEGDEHRIRTVKTDQQTIDKLRQEISQLREQLNKSKENYDKLKKRKEKQIQELESELKRQHNQNQIQQRSYESIIRALVDTMRRIYTALDIHLRKKGRRIEQAPDFDELTNNPGKIDSLKVYESFERALQALKD